MQINDGTKLEAGTRDGGFATLVHFHGAGAKGDSMKLAKIIILFCTAIVAGLAAEHHGPCIKWSLADLQLQLADKFERSNASSILVEVNVSPSDAKVPRHSLIVVVKAVGNYSNGKIEEIGTWIATASRLYSAMSPVLFDTLTLGALDVSERYDRVLYVEFTTPLCEGSTPDVMEGVVQSVSKPSCVARLSCGWTWWRENVKYHR